MSVESVIANTPRIAKADLEGAVALEALGNRNAAYLCEQAAEKVIRAVLTSENIRAGVRHQLDEMVQQIPDANPVKPLLQQIEGLALYATTYRYTTPSGRIPSPPDANQFALLLKKVDEAIQLTATRFGVDLTRKDLPAKNPAPIR